MKGYTQINVIYANNLYRRPANQYKSDSSMTNEVYDTNLMLLACPDFYIIQAPTSISQLAACGALKRHLNVTWPDFTITDKASNKSILASQKLPIL